MRLKEFLKPNWIKILFFFILVLPLSMIIYPFVSMIFMPFSFIIVELIKILSPKFTISEGFIMFLFPLIMSLILVYLISCGIEVVYKKKKSKTFLYVSIVIGVILTIGIFAYSLRVPYKVIKDSPAPGCVVHTGISWGGCSGKTIIKDLKIAPVIPCLEIHENNCNGGVISIHNRCEKDLRIGDLQLPYLITESISSEIIAKLIKDEEENVILVKQGTKKWSISKAYEKKYEFISSQGKVENKSFNILIKESRLYVNPEIHCLDIKFYTGNEPYIDTMGIRNYCNDTVTIAGVDIEPYTREVKKHETRTSIELMKDEYGNVIAKRSRGNYASYTPSRNETLSILGELGKQPIIISYVKTAKLCD